MIKQDSSTLESIIQAARAMSGIPKPASGQKPLPPEAMPDQESSSLPGDAPTTEQAALPEHRPAPEDKSVPENTRTMKDSVSAGNTSAAENTTLTEDTASTADTASAEDTAFTADTASTADTAATADTASAEDTSDSLHTVGIHFLEFAVAFLTLSKCQYQQDCGLKVNSLAFFTLIALDSWADEDFTMSELAEKLQITKQQFSRLINDLEEKGLVERIHDTSNRRRVYIRICPSGRQVMDSLKQDMLASTLHGLRAYTSDELSQMDACICSLVKLMEKFNTDPSGA